MFILQVVDHVWCGILCLCIESLTTWNSIWIGCIHPPPASLIIVACYQDGYLTFRWHRCWVNRLAASWNHILMEMIRDLIRIFNPSVYNMIVYNLGEAWAIWSENPPNNSLHVRLVKPSQFSTCSWKKLNLYINSGFSFLAILAIKYIPPQKSRYNPSIRLCQLCRCLRRLQPTGIRSSRLSRAVSEVRKMRHPGGLYLMI